MVAVLRNYHLQLNNRVGIPPRDRFGSKTCRYVSSLFSHTSSHSYPSAGPRPSQHLRPTSKRKTNRDFATFHSDHIYTPKRFVWHHLCLLQVPLSSPSILDLRNYTIISRLHYVYGIGMKFATFSVDFFLEVLRGSLPSHCAWSSF